jgi:hypothetical protein
MGEQKTPSDTDRIAKLEHLVAEQARTIAWMQRLGGFTDAKTIGVRCARIEKRVELLELDGEMLKDVVGLQQGLVEHHLKDRHDLAAGFDRDDSPDVIPWRRIRKRLREWAEKRGLMAARRDVSDVRKDENRARPRQGSAVPA